MENKIVFECKYELINHYRDCDWNRNTVVEEIAVLQCDTLEGLYELMATTKAEKDWIFDEEDGVFGEVKFDLVREICILSENHIDKIFFEKTEAWQNYIKQEELKKKHKEEQEKKRKQLHEEEELKTLERLKDKYGM